MKKTLAAALLGATLLAGAAHAAQDRPQARPMRGDPLARADADKDGIVTRDEFLADLARRFAKADANGDGKLSAEERPGRGEMMRADTDGDGFLSLDEQRAQASRRFDRMDANGDGRLDQAERQAMRNRMGGRGGPGARGATPPADVPASSDAN